MLIQAPEGHFECQVFCAKTIVIVKDCCLVAGGLCRSMAGRGLVSGSRQERSSEGWMERSGTPAEPSGNHSASRQCLNAKVKALGLRRSLPDGWHRSRQIRRTTAQSKLRSSAQRLLRLLCASNAQKMQINRDFTLSRKLRLTRRHQTPREEQRSEGLVLMVCT